MVADITRMEAMIAEVLAFARERSAQPRRVPVRAVLEEVVARARDTGAAVVLSPGDEVHVQADAASFRRAVENLCATPSILPTAQWWPPRVEAA